MLKKWSLLFLLIFFGLEAGAREFSLRYENYIHLSEAEKNQTVIQLMEFVVELESKYEYDVRKYGEHSPQVQKLKETLLTINNFLLSSAHADTSQDGWPKYAADFKNLFLESRDANCIFAGWPSKTYLYNGRSICSHPSKTSSSRINNRYPKAGQGSQCAKGGTNKIQCNPTLFGFQDMQKKTLFCVDSSNGAQNSAYHCMKLALSDSDSQKEQRLKMLRENLDKSPEIFNALQKYVYELCICKATPDGFDKSYHDRIRPHRTCYGMMNMLGAVSCEMENVEPLKDTSIFKDLKDKISMSAAQSEIDSLYVNFLKDVPTSAPEEYARMCPNDPGITISKDDKGKPPTGEPDGDAATAGATSGAQGGTPDGADPSQERYECRKAVCTKGEETYSCEFDIHDNEKDEALQVEEPQYEAPKDDKAESLTVKFKIGEEEHSLTCSIEQPSSDTVDDDNEPSLTLTITDKGDKAYDVKAVPKNDKGWTLVWTLKLPKTLPAKNVKKGWDDPKAKKKDDKDKTGKPPAGLASDSEESEEPAEKKDDSKEESAAPEEVTPKVTEKKTDVPDKISQERKNVDYEVCAQLTQGKDKKAPKDPVCVKVDKLGNAAPTGPTGMMPQQQAPLRRASDTSAMGIR